MIRAICTLLCLATLVTTALPAQKRSPATLVATNATPFDAVDRHAA